MLFLGYICHIWLFDFRLCFWVVSIMSTFELGTEFDIMRSLVFKLGFKGEDIERFMAAILHTVNQVLRGEVDARSQV